MSITMQAGSHNLDRMVGNLLTERVAALPVVKTSHRKGAVPLQALIALPDRRKRR